MGQGNQGDRWDAGDYEQSSSAQLVWARELIAKLNLQGDECVLDLGCGDGKITAEIAKLLPKGSAVGIDSSQAMIELAQTRHATQRNLKFLRLDACHLNFSGEFTLIFSNAVLHWIEDHPAVLQGIGRSLRPGGKILLQMGGLGNAADMIDAVETVTQTHSWQRYFTNFTFPYHFYSPQDYEQWLPAAGLKPQRLELIPKDMTHAGKAGLAGWLRTTWFPYLQQVPESQRDRLLAEIVDCYLDRHPMTADGKTHVRMVRLEVEAAKN